MNTDGSPLEFPADIHIKVFGRNDAGFRAAVVGIIERHYGTAYTLRETESKRATYLGLTVTVRAESRAEIDGVYRELVAHELVLLAL